MTVACLALKKWGHNKCGLGAKLEVHAWLMRYATIYENLTQKN